jgi:hypothetical protein
MKCPYDKCDGSGLIPAKDKEGNIIPYAWSHCDCHPQYGVDAHEHYQEIRPEDFDFPCSDTFRSYYYHHCGVPDPGSDRPVENTWVEDLEDRIGNLEATIKQRPEPQPYSRIMKQAQPIKRSKGVEI